MLPLNRRKQAMSPVCAVFSTARNRQFVTCSRTDTRVVPHYILVPLQAGAAETQRRLVLIDTRKKQITHSLVAPSVELSAPAAIGRRAIIKGRLYSEPNFTPN